MPTKIDWSRPIENRYGPCKFLHKLKNTDNPSKWNHVVISLDTEGKEQCMFFDDEGDTYFKSYVLRNVVEHSEVYIPFGIAAAQSAHHKIAAEFAQASLEETNKPYAIRLTLIDNVPHSVELLTLPNSVELLTLPKDLK